MERLCNRCSNEFLNCFFKREAEALYTTFEEETIELLHQIEDHPESKEELLKEAQIAASHSQLEIGRLYHQAQQDDCPFI